MTGGGQPAPANGSDARLATGLASQHSTVRRGAGDRRRLLLCRLLALGWLLGVLAILGSPAQAWAHEGQPVVSQAVQAGPYPLVVEVFGMVRAGQPLQLRLVPSTSGVRQVEVVLRPGGNTAASAVPARVQPDPDLPGAFSAEPTVLVRGDWVVDVRVAGDAGEGLGSMPLAVDGPAEIPLWLGWAIGLSPLLGVAAFGAWQSRWLRRQSINRTSG